MIINHNYKFIYLKSRKTGSTSLEIALSKFCGPQAIITKISPKDEKIRQKMGYPGPQNENVKLSHYSFKDWAHALRYRKFRKFYNHIPAKRVKDWVPKEVWDDYFIFSFERNPFDKAVSRYYWDLSNMDNTPEINNYLKEIPVNRLSNWEIYGIKDKIVADRVFTYENLQESLKDLRAILRLPEEINLPKAKAKHRKTIKNYNELLNQESQQYIESVCQKEIEQFNYSF